MLSLTWKDVWARRLARHALLAPAPAAQMADVVGAVCGIHAQMMPAAELSLGLRVEGVTRRDIAAALWQDRALVKSYGIRGTLHLFPAQELPLWMAALQAREALDPRPAPAGALDEDQRAGLVDAIGEALDGQALTLPQLGAAVVARVGAWAGEVTGQAWAGGWPRWRQALGAAALAGRLCYGPPAGQAVTFVRADHWIGGWRPVPPQDALAEVLRRYLRAYGPATTRDFAQWFAIPPRAARDLAATLGSELQEVDVEGYRGLRLAADTAPPAAADPDSVRLLPHFDCYVVGCFPRDQLAPPAWAARVPARSRVAQFPALLIDGVVAGLWERRAQGRRLAVRVEPLAPLEDRHRALLEAEAARIGAILEAEATLTVGEVAARPHL